jgi:type IV pilus assembly protein PilX
MRIKPVRTARAQRGMALVSAMLLLVIITILSLSMFRSFGTQEKVAGNVREKERALHAAESAQQYAEWWLLTGNNLSTGAVTCTGGLLNANAGEGQICNQTLTQILGLPDSGPSNGVAQLGNLIPWIIPGGPVGVTMTPASMTISASGGFSSNGFGNNTSDYYSLPVFYIADIGKAADGLGEDYQIDAYAYGASANAVAVVESVYEVSKGVSNLGGP